MPPLRDSEDYDARVVAWESRDSELHVVYDWNGDKVGNAPSDHSLEVADRVVIEWDGEFYTVDALTDDYTLDDAIAELEDQYP